MEERILELQAELRRLMREAETLLTEARGREGNPGLTEEERTRYSALSERMDAVEAEIEALEAQERRSSRLAEPRRSGQEGDEPGDRTPDGGGAGVRGARRGEAGARGDDPNEFRDLPEFMEAVMFRRNDPRLQDLYRDAEHRDQEMGTGALGGFMVPTQFRPEVMRVDPESAIIRPRAQVIPAGSPPDAKVSLPALDQSGGRNMEGGVEVRWIEEGGTKHKTDFALREISMEPKEVAGYIPLTDKLLRNWQAASTFASNRLREALVAAAEAKFARGTGVGTPLGWIAEQAGGTMSVARQLAGDVLYEDIVSMDERVWGNGRVWIGTSRVRGRLRRMEDTEGHLIWQDSARPGAPPTLLGYPFLEYHRTPQLGQRGDLSLVSLENYLIKDGSGPFVAFSEHVQFLDNKTVVKIFANVDGQPWLTQPLVLDNGDEVSPFVVLDLVQES